MVLTWLIATWDIIALSATWMLVGFFLAGVIHVLLPTSIVRALLAKPGISSVLKSSAIGIPLPLCSCSVIPVGVSLHKSGASKGATASFMVSTPEIGVDSFLLSYGLLGPLISAVRVISAFISAVFVGTLIDTFVRQEDQKESVSTGANCCAHSSENSGAPPESAAPVNKLREILRFGVAELVDDLSLTLVIGFFLAGAISTLIPGDALQLSNFGVYTSMLVMYLISLPVYVCATSSTPIAAALLAKGLNPGAVLIFLLAGPASNITTILAIRNQLGRKALYFYLTGVAVVTFTSAVVINAVWGTSPSRMAMIVFEHHQHHSVIDQFTGALLVAILLASLFRKLRSKIASRAK